CRVYGGSIRAAYGAIAGKDRCRAGNGDGVRQRVFAAAGVFADSVCCGARREFLWGLRRVHRRGFPNVSLLALGAAAVCFCFFSLADVIAALVVLRILMQFLLQHVGVIYLRRRQPEMKRPFRVWLYPVPPLLAIAGFIYMVAARTHVAGFREIVGAAVVVALGTAVYMAREWVSVRWR